MSFMVDADDLSASLVSEGSSSSGWSGVVTLNTGTSYDPNEHADIPTLYLTIRDRETPGVIVYLKVFREDSLKLAKFIHESIVNISEEFERGNY